MPRRKHVGLAVAAAAGVVLVGTFGAQAQIAPVEQGFTKERSAELAGQIDPAKPRNVILIIGDGMDDSMITAARNYEKGASGRFEGLDALPFTGAMTTHGLKAGEGPDYPIAYVSDSAPTASGWSTGKKTIDGRISQGPSSAANVPGEDYGTVLEQYKADGKLVGNVSTAEVTDATPAAAASHINARACQGPADMANCAPAKKANGGKGSIAEQLVDNKIDVLLGGGLNRYNQATDDGPTVKEYAETTRDYRFVGDKAGLDAVTSLKDGPVLGLFTGGNMTPEYKSLVATAPPGVGGPETRCETADRGNQPDFAQMTAKAIELLDNEKGFFLQAESAMIDKQEHASDICGAIGDVKALDEAVQVALDFQAENPDTLIIVTGDHAHSTQIVGGADQGRQTATVKTADGDPMTVAYSTSASGSNHTGAQIRVAASGPQAANVTGVIDQTDLYATMLGRTPSKLPVTTVPAKPSASLAAAKKVSSKVLAKRGISVVTAASASTSVKVTLVKGAKTLATKKAAKTGGVVTLKAKKVTGKVTVVVTATGPGGTTTAKTKVTVTR
ncbi:alkaline phosphatase [Nocardioides sp. Bht2]|uniref:alkaline phosphatase n=1 Tax=Nocardioides sp. Bht2 TaxID=3392297 RepID=UPI0039B4C9AD